MRFPQIKLVDIPIEEVRRIQDAFPIVGKTGSIPLSDTERELVHAMLHQQKSESGK